MTQKQPLRKRAEKTLKTNKPQDLKVLSTEEARRLVHELQVHQIELDMQNEELRQTLAERDASHTRYVDLYDLAPVGYCTLGEKGRILEANLTAATLLGVARSTLIRQPFTRFLFKEDQDLYYRHRKQLFQSGESQACELRMVKKDGTLFWTRLEAVAVQDFPTLTGQAADNEPVYRVVLSDITDRKQAETALKTLYDELEKRVAERTAELEAAMKTLKDDEERFRTVADFTYNWETWIGPDGRYIYVSPSCKRISGYLPWDFYKDPSLMERIIHPQDLAGWNRAMAEGLERKGEAFFECRIITCSGEERWISINSQAVYNRNGQWLGRRDSYRDTTERKRAKAELQDSRARFQALVESTHDWVWETDTNGIYGYVSPRSVELLGYAPEEIVGKSPLEFIPPGQLKDAKSRLKKTLKTGKPFHVIERVCRHREGHTVIVESSGVPYFDSLGNLAGFRGIDRDVTERKNLEAQTLRTRHLVAIGELAAGVAHEINNPINGIINYAQILVDDASASGGDPDIPLRIIKEGDRIAEIVKNLLYFSRQSRGEKKPVSVRLILEDSLALFAAQFRKEGISVSVDIPDDIPPVIANRQQIQQVFMNILGNSRHALLRRPNGFKQKMQIKITASVPKPKGVKMVTLCFFDNGMGIAPELQERVFDPFFTTKALGEGTGLGLSISYGIVNDHGGYLFIESEPGEYTHVWVFLPAGTTG